MLTQLINRSCQIVRRSASDDIDDYGNEEPVEIVVNTVCEIQQRRRQEHDDAVAETDWIGFFLPDEDIDSGDSVLVDTGEFEVIGDPWPVRSPRVGEVSHIEASLKRTAGSDDAS